MRIWALLCGLTFWSVAAAYGDTPEENRCAITAAAQLPKVEGLKVSAIRIEPNARYSDSRLVIFDVNALDRQATYTFVCSWYPDGYRVVPFGMK